MSIMILLLIALMQFVIQALLYFTSVFFLYKIIHWLTKVLCLLVGRCQENYNRVIVLLLLVYNIAISCLVLAFTGIGVYAGISNLFASALLGVVMCWQFKKGGKYYLKYVKKPTLWQRIKKLFTFKKKNKGVNYENNN